ncbi:DUF3892 domain-containing protein [Bacillus sp. FJAT-29790]|uniref:DUF3892 domain-containing protein n=1 Tax=Bacillus sp. FJAT-29790 TaxID=1895002 RepID=UPI001C22A996|nr:DUF3892 domain-containing protein [Bacillus sp. FJAT-29790]MBU8878978.1 DUF3892 domain-containing protein [Bacillus sp. FJAT-29790]
MNGEQLIAVHRNNYGDIISFQTSKGRIISYRKALQEAENGIISGVRIGESEDGVSYLTPEITPSFDELPNIY